MWRLALTVVFAFTSLAASRAGTAHPRFAGSWRMDPARSESAHQDVPIGLSTMVIRMNEAGVTIETRRDATENSPEFHESLSFAASGAETVSTGSSGGMVKGRAHWDGAKLVTETVREIQGSTVTTTYVHTLSADGREMIVDKTLTVQHGYMGMSATNVGKGRDVFVRVVSR